MAIRYSKYINFSLFVIVGLAIPVALVFLTANNMSVFTRDVFAVTQAPPIVGFLSNIGAFVWCASLSAIVLTIFVIRHDVSGTRISFLYSSALITGWILLDDFFMVHEWWFRFLGIREIYAFIGLAVAIVSYIVIFSRIILKTHYVLFLLALAFLFLSLAVDFAGQYGLIPNTGRWYHIFEDGPKWIGACFWAAYFFSTTRRALGTDFANRLRRDDPLRNTSK